MDELGLSRRPATSSLSEWDYESLENPPQTHLVGDQLASSTYRGIVPAKNILSRDFAVNGASVRSYHARIISFLQFIRQYTTNPGYTWEVTAHWIASYLRGDKFLRIPHSPEKALAHTEREAAWLRKRFPDMLLWPNESYSSSITLWK